VPDIASWHPLVVHFVIALAFVGVGARIVSLIPGERLRFANPMATWLIVMAAIAGVIAAQSGSDAHGPVERVPGARNAVQNHEDAGEWARDALLVLAVFEIGALALSSRAKGGKAAQVVAAVVGVAVLATVYRAADFGGDLVYSYAGGIGLRSGDTADVKRLLIAGLYHDAARARTAHDTATASRLIHELQRQLPTDTSVRFLVIESLMKDQAKPRDALDSLRAMQVPATNRRVATQRAMMMADAYVALGHPDSARQTLMTLKASVPPQFQGRVQQAIDRLPH
jgi:uncharacterized membrane protein